MSPLEEDLNHAIAEVLARHETSMVTRWIALVETIDDSGATGLWTMTSEGIKAWDTVGMLGHALDIQRAQTFGYTTGLIHPEG